MPYYQVSVRQVSALPKTSFRCRITTDTIAVGCTLADIRLRWGLTPIRLCPCRANSKRQLTRNELVALNFPILGISLANGTSGKHSRYFHTIKTSKDLIRFLVCMLSFAIRFLSLIKSVFLWFPPQNIIPFQMNRKVTRGPICYNSQHWSCVTSPCSW